QFRAQEPLHTFAGIALKRVASIRIHATCFRPFSFIPKPLRTFARHALNDKSPAGGRAFALPGTQ
ncbi:hypothetical protein ACC753_37120, partial [Rhizobium ruizarguesonis]